MTFPGLRSRRSLINVNERAVTALVNSFTCEVEKSANKDEFGNKVITVKCHGKLVAETAAEMKGVVHPPIPLGGRIIVDLNHRKIKTVFANVRSTTRRCTGAHDDVLQILAGDSSEFVPATVIQPGQGRVPLLVFRGIARTLQFFRSRLIAVSFSSRMLQMVRIEFRHPGISVQSLTETLLFSGAKPAKPQNL